MEKLSINLYSDFTLSHLGNVLNTSLLKVLGNSDSYPNKNVKENSDWHNGYYLAVVNKRF